MLSYLKHIVEQVVEVTNKALELVKEVVDVAKAILLGKE